MELIDAMKKAWRYIKNYKKMITITIGAMFIVQFLGMLSPLIVKTLIDEQVLGVMKPYYKVENFDEKTVEYNGKFYRQEKNLLPSDSKSAGELSIFYFDKSFYSTESHIISGLKRVSGDLLTVTDKEREYKYLIKKLSIQDVKNFYKPLVKSMIFLVLMLLVSPLFSAMFGYIQRICSSRVTIAITRDGREDAAECIHKMPVKYFEEEPVGKTAARISQDVSGITMMLDKILNLGFSATFSFFMAYYFMFKLDSQLALFTFILFPVYMIWIYFFTGRINKYAVKINELGSLITAKLNENINGVNIIKSFNFENGAMKSFNKINEEFMDQSMKEVKLHVTFGWNLINFLKGISTVAIIGYFGYRQIYNPEVAVTAGLIYAYTDYIQRIINPLFMLFREFGNIEHSIVKTNRFFTIIDAPKEDTSFKIIPRYKGEVAFENLWFGYNPSKYVLKGVNIKIEAGTMCGIVGHTGSGKTTLMNLLERFYDMKKGD
ncbi:MAG: ABC transporter transmembrane domain-containing protein, partial [Fusobacteriaceae bacterium]